MKDITTKFPLQIDSRIFFSDLPASQVSVMKQYYILLSNGAYTRASELLKNSGVFYYGAWCLNLLENRLFAIENYVMDLEEINLLKYSESEPSENLDECFTWIE